MRIPWYLIFFLNAFSISCSKDTKESPHLNIQKSSLSSDLYTIEETDFTDPISKLQSKYAIMNIKEITDYHDWRILLYFHGDGNDGGYAQMLNEFYPFALDKKILPIAIKTPTKKSWWEENAQNNAQYAHSVLTDELIKKRGFRQDAMIWAGSSGGANFVSMLLLPLYGHNYNGTAVFFCGGHYPYAPNYEFIDPDHTLSKAFKIILYTQKGDYMYSEGQVQQSEQFYWDQGFSVTASYPDGIGHCGFSLSQVVGGLDL